VREGEPRAEGEIEAYWTEDVELGEAVFFDEPYMVRAQVHTAQEPYRGRNDADILRLSWPTGTRDYVQIHPYLLTPDIAVEIGLYERPTPSGEVGEVVATDWRGMRHERIGDGQAWHYPADRVIVLWECTLFDRFAHEELLGDRNLMSVWRGFERFLVDRFPDAERIVTPAWEPGYGTATWHQFLGELGYTPVSDQACAREVVRP
jgi:hypothetical protein